jgi:hypothetical protein
VFATGEMANLLQPEGLAGLFVGTGLFKSKPLRRLGLNATGFAAGQNVAFYFRFAENNRESYLKLRLIWFRKHVAVIFARSPM